MGKSKAARTARRKRDREADDAFKGESLTTSAFLQREIDGNALRAAEDEAREGCGAIANLKEFRKTIITVKDTFFFASAEQKENLVDSLRSLMLPHMGGGDVEEGTFALVANLWADRAFFF